MKDRFLVSTAQMQEIESQVFAAGMPIAALMEKVGGLIARRFQYLYPRWRSLSLGELQYHRVGILVGMGHNGGDALVVARELYFQGYEVSIYVPISQLVELTDGHYRYVRSLGIEIIDRPEDFAGCDAIVDGLFGCGLNREITDRLFDAIESVNQLGIPIISIDLPSGIHTDTGLPMGTAIKATHTFCLGLWKLAFFQESAIEYLGKTELIDLDLPLSIIDRVLGINPMASVMTTEWARSSLPLDRSPTTHKYQQGHLLLIVGSEQYAGAAILAGLGARATGVGMLSIAVPKSLKYLLSQYLPEALIISCPETEIGTIESLPDLDFTKYQAIACGCGLTEKPSQVVDTIIRVNCPIVIDADALNIIAKHGIDTTIHRRTSPTILTPHLGEFKRLFPNINPFAERDAHEALSKCPLCGIDKIAAAIEAAQSSQAIVLFKGAITVIAQPNGRAIVIPESTPALARGGSGDVLTGLIGGLVATNIQRNLPIAEIVASAAWWHSQAAILAVIDRGELGVDPVTLTQYLTKVIQNQK
jgi:ADP-dependent NAD(P)H-hydrate dehydratase / NAD(P)H-hydrate epimerase